MNTLRKWRVLVAVMCWGPKNGLVYRVPNTCPPARVLFFFEKVISSVLAGSAWRPFQWSHLRTSSKHWVAVVVVVSLVVEMV